MQGWGHHVGLKGLISFKLKFAEMGAERFTLKISISYSLELLNQLNFDNTEKSWLELHQIVKERYSEPDNQLDYPLWIES